MDSGTQQDSIQLCLIGHNSEELLFVDLPILIKIELINHGLSNALKALAEFQKVNISDKSVQFIVF